MISALLIRLASLSLPKKIRQKYLRAWLAELQDAKTDGEGWAFAYDLLANMGSLRKAAKGEDILYRNQTKTPLWLSMGSLGTAVLATVVAVSFWNGLKTPPKYVNVPTDTRQVENTGSAAFAAPLAAIDATIEADALAVDDALLSIDSLSAENLNAGDFNAQARAISNPQDQAKTIAQAEQVEQAELVQSTEEATDTSDTSASVSNGTIEVTASQNSDVQLETQESNIAQSDIQASVDTATNEESTSIATESGAQFNEASLSNSTSALSPTEETLITPLPAVETQANAIQSIDTDIIPPTDAVIVETTAETTAEISIVEEAISAIPVAPVQVVGIPGEEGIPNIPGVEDTSTSLAESPDRPLDNAIAAPSTAPAVTAPVVTMPLSAAPPLAIPPAAAAPLAPVAPLARSAATSESIAESSVSPVVVEVQPLVDESEPTLSATNTTAANETVVGTVGSAEAVGTIGPAGPMGPVGFAESTGSPVTVPAITEVANEVETDGISSEFQAPTDIDTTIVIRESEIERPDISEDLTDLRQRLLAGAEASAETSTEAGIALPDAETQVNNNVQEQLDEAQKSMQALSQNQLTNQGMSNTSENQLGLPGRSGDTNGTVAQAKNPITDIADENIQRLIEEFLDTGDLSFENSAELITKLAEKLELGEEEIRQLLRALVGRLEP